MAHTVSACRCRSRQRFPLLSVGRLIVAGGPSWALHDPRWRPASVRHRCQCDGRCVDGAAHTCPRSAEGVLWVHCRRLFNGTHPLDYVAQPVGEILNNGGSLNMSSVISPPRRNSPVVPLAVQDLPCIRPLDYSRLFHDARFAFQHLCDQGEDHHIGFSSPLSRVFLLCRRNAFCTHSRFLHSGPLYRSAPCLRGKRGRSILRCHRTARRHWNHRLAS